MNTSTKFHRHVLLLLFGVCLFLKAQAVVVSKVLRVLEYPENPSLQIEGLSCAWKASKLDIEQQR